MELHFPKLMNKNAKRCEREGSLWRRAEQINRKREGKEAMMKDSRREGMTKGKKCESNFF